MIQFDSPIKSQRNKKLTLTDELLTFRYRNISIRFDPVIFICRDQGPFLLQAMNAYARSLAQPLGNRAANPTSHDIAAA